MPDIARTLGTILGKQKHLRGQSALLVAISGIDGSGKGFVAHQLAADLDKHGLRVATINVDGWQNLPDKRHDPQRPAEHFYEHAIRFDELFARLILPLKETRSIRIEADFTEQMAAAYRKYIYEYTDVDIILLEGIFLLKRTHRDIFNLAFWIDCSFETALARALARNQEGLPPDEVIREYDTIYFPAQRLHFERDRPRDHADGIIVNDPRLKTP